jgi:hypothetical protein
MLPIKLLITIAIPLAAAAVSLRNTTTTSSIIGMIFGLPY